MKLSNKVIFLVAKKNNEGGRKLSYYFKMGNGNLEYVCTRNYSGKCYELCQSGIPLNDLLYGRKRLMKNRAFEGLVSYMQYIWPYFQKEYGFVS